MKECLAWQGSDLQPDHQSAVHLTEPLSGAVMVGIYSRWNSDDCTELFITTIHLGRTEPYLSPAFSKKSGGTLFLVFRGAWRVVRGSEFLVGTLSP